jgi:hypothetical protein
VPIIVPRAASASLEQPQWLQRERRRVSVVVPGVSVAEAGEAGADGDEGRPR